MLRKELYRLENNIRMLNNIYERERFIKVIVECLEKAVFEKVVES